MSANNQTLIKEYKGKWYVFTNVNAESWGWNEEKNEPAPNTLSIKEADGIFNTRDEAYNEAVKLTDYEVEYGVQFNRLCKDDAEVILIE